LDTAHAIKTGMARLHKLSNRARELCYSIGNQAVGKEGCDGTGRPCLTPVGNVKPQCRVSCANIDEF